MPTPALSGPGAQAFAELSEPFPDEAPLPWQQRLADYWDPGGIDTSGKDPRPHPLPELEAWHTGETGIPLVDAGMRELWHTGYMHNRVRMVVGSFLTKNLGIH